MKFEIKDGKGNIKEYDYFDGRIEFEGEYLNGERSGKGKEYGECNLLSFEGEYSKGRKNGKGKEYDQCGFLRFEGEYLDGERNGKGKLYFYKY